MDPVIAKLAAANKTARRARRGTVGEKVSGAELGALMSFMSSKVLGQFDPFWDGPDGEGGRLLLVAPNIVQVERQLDVDPHDFRLWVCLHEETHRVQFTAVDWMRGHMRSLIDEFIDATDLDASALSSLVTDGLGEASRSPGATRRPRSPTMFQNERQREIVDQLTGIMSLLEGHADVVMDGVGPEVIPSVAEIRRKFTQRRKGGGSVRPADPPPAGPRRQDAPVPRRRRVRAARSTTRSASTASTPCGPSRPTCRPSPRSSTRRRGSPASTAELVGMGGALDPAVATGRNLVRSALADLAPGSRVVVGGLRRCRLAGAGRRHGVRGRPRGVRPVGRGRRPPAAARVGRRRRQGRASSSPASASAPEVVTVEVGTAGGPEAAARAARYEALERTGADAVLLAHTLDDQAETVLLGLGRGSGPRSIAGMAPRRRGAPAARSSACAAPTPSRSAGRTASVVGRPAQQRPGVPAVARARRGHAAARGRAGRGSRRGARRGPPTRCAPTSTTSTTLAARRRGRATSSRPSPRCRPPCARGCCAAAPSRPAPTGSALTAVAPRRARPARHRLARPGADRAARRHRVRTGGGFPVVRADPCGRLSPWTRRMSKVTSSSTRPCSPRSRSSRRLKEMAAEIETRLRGQGPPARRRAQGRGHGHGRPGPQPRPARRDGLDGGVVLRLGHQVVRRRAHPQGPRHRPAAAATS